MENGKGRITGQETAPSEKLSVETEQAPRLSSTTPVGSPKRLGDDGQPILVSSSNVDVSTIITPASGHLLRPAVISGTIAERITRSNTASGAAARKAGVTVVLTLTAPAMGDSDLGLATTATPSCNSRTISTNNVDAPFHAHFGDLVVTKDAPSTYHRGEGVTGRSGTP